MILINLNMYAFVRMVVMDPLEDHYKEFCIYDDLSKESTFSVLFRKSHDSVDGKCVSLGFLSLPCLLV